MSQKLIFHRWGSPDTPLDFVDKSKSVEMKEALIKLRNLFVGLVGLFFILYIFTQIIIGPREQLIKDVRSSEQIFYDGLIIQANELYSDRMNK